MTLMQLSQLFHIEEADLILAACPQSRTLEGLSAEDAENLLEWAENIRLSNACLDLVLAGKLGISFVDGVPYFAIVES